MSSASDKFETLETMVAKIRRSGKITDDLIPHGYNRIKIARIINGECVLVSENTNARTNSGALWQASVMGSTAGTPANFIALSGTVLSPAMGDTTLPGEITTNGLARVQATYQNYIAPSILSGSASYDLAVTFTCTANGILVSSAATFNVISGGSLFTEANLSPALTLNNGDQIVLVWTITI